MSDPTITIALAGDTMLGRGMADAIDREPHRAFVSDEVAELTRAADVFVLNLECCLSNRGSPWPDPSKAFFFRAPPRAASLLAAIGVSCVTLANNHALDYGEGALIDTFRHLGEAGISWVGAGSDTDEARAPVILSSHGFRLGILAFTDHPPDYEARPDRPGTAFADLHQGVPSWVTESIAAVDADALLVTPHWGPNMTSEPLPYIRTAARSLVDAGATIVAGHSAHVPHGIAGSVLFDLGDFVDDYHRDPVLRNDLGLLFLVTLERSETVRLEAVPIKLEYCFTGLADGEDADEIVHRFTSACRRLGTAAHVEHGRVVVP
jgi:poly-gamma-glutamate capsule biosynthesis protein CapA/YwtB (metallophosphatase superfamily)